MRFNPMSRPRPETVNKKGCKMRWYEVKRAVPWKLMAGLVFLLAVFFPEEGGKSARRSPAPEPPAMAPGQTAAPPVLPEEFVPRIQVFPSRKSGEVILRQGQVFLVRVSGLPSATISAHAMWEGQTIPLSADDQPGQWSGVGGVAVDQKPGRYELTMAALTHDDRQFLAGTDFTVAGRKYSRARLSVSPDMIRLSPQAQSQVDADREAFRAVWANPAETRYWEGPFVRPVPGRITAGFGQRRVYNGEVKSVHNGVDLAADYGEAVRSAAAGKVVLVRDAYIEGTTVVLDHGAGLFTLYCHLSRAKVEVGQMVEKGQVIALAGASGRVTGPHLHYGGVVQGVKIDPLSLLLLNPWLDGKKHSG